MKYLLLLENPEIRPAVRTDCHKMTNICHFLQFLAIGVYVIIWRALIRDGPVAPRQVAPSRGRLGPPRERGLMIRLPFMSAPRRAFKRHKVVPAAIRNDGDKAEPPPSSACSPNTGPTLTTSMPLKFSSASSAIAAFCKSREEDLAGNVNHFTLDQPGPAHHLSKQQKVGNGPMALYRATAAVIFGSLAIAVSSRVGLAWGRIPP